jgi:hypothetical protein
MKKTIDWTEAKDLLLRKAADSFGAPLFDEEIHDFVDFMRTYSFINLKKLTEFLVAFADNPRFTDMSARVYAMEDQTLFSHKDTHALDLILRAPDTLVAWKYLDTDKKSVVHYAYNYLSATYLEAFFYAEEKSSYLHICENDGKDQIVPVLFTPEFDTFLMAADLNGSQTIRAYLPRERFQFLSKRSGLHEKHPLRDDVHAPDNGDLL